MTALQWRNSGHSNIVGGGPFASSGTISAANDVVGSGFYSQYSPSVNGDLTVEFWYRINPLRADWSGIFGTWAPAYNTPGYISFMIGATYTICSCGGQEIFHSGTARYADSLAVGWHHIAIVRHGSAWTVYLDGVGTLFSSVVDTNSISLYGADFSMNNDTNYYTEFRWVSDLRITALARYTANFAVPTAPFNLSTDPIASSVVAQVECTQSYDTFDATKRSLWTTTGGVTIDTTVKQYGTSSMHFDGTGYLTTQISPDFNLAGASWTVDLWINPSAPTNWAFFTYPTTVAGDTIPIAIGMSSTGDISTTVAAGYVLGAGYWNGSAWTFIKNGTSTLTLNTWSHVELGFDSTTGTAYFFLNGVLISSIAWAGPTGLNWANTSGLGLSLGTGWDHTSSTPFKGWMQEICVLKGVCRNKVNFTPPTGPYNPTTDTYAANMIALLHGTQLPVVSSSQIYDDLPMYGGKYSLFEVDSIDYADVYQTSKVWSTSGQVDVGILEPLPITRSNSRYIQDFDDSRTLFTALTSTPSHHGFIHGICVVQGVALPGCVLELTRNLDFQIIARTSSDVNGLYQFDDIQLDGGSGYYLITARPNPLNLNENAQSYMTLNATPYDITTTGSFSYTPGSTTVNSTVAIVGNAATFTVSVAAGSLPPGATVSVSGRNISIGGATSIPNDYVFTLLITGSVRAYSALIQFELVQTGTTSLGTTVDSDGSLVWLSNNSTLMMSTDFNGLATPTTFNSSIPGLPGFNQPGGGTPTLSATQHKFGDSALYLNGAGSFVITPTYVVNPTGTFTIECWIYLNALKNYNVVWNNYPNNGNQVAIPVSGAYYWSNGTAIVLTGNTPLLAGQWYHMALTRNASNNLTWWRNGVADGTVVYTGPLNTGALSNQIQIGVDTGRSTTNSMNGYVNGFKMWNTCQYTSTFTPAAAPFVPNLIHSLAYP